MIVTANQQALSNERGCFERKGPSDAGVTTDMIISTAKCAIDDSFYVRPTVQKPAGCIKLDPSPTLRTRPNYGPDCEGQVRRLRLSDGAFVARTPHTTEFISAYEYAGILRILRSDTIVRRHTFRAI